MEPHYQQTRAEGEAEAVVLPLQDTTEIDLSHRGKVAGIGQIGNAKGRGMLLQTVLAVVPQTRAILGCLAQKPFVRIPAPQKEQRYQRRHREQRETDVWMQMVEQIGSLNSTSMLVHVGDRGAEMFPFFRACLLTQTHFVVRGAQNCRIAPQDQEIGHLLDQGRAWPSQGDRPFVVPASHGHIGRETKLEISFGQASILPPCNDPRGSPRPVAPVGCSGLGRGRTRRRSPLGMDLAHFCRSHYPRAALAMCGLVSLPSSVPMGNREQARHTTCKTLLDS